MNNRRDPHECPRCGDLHWHLEKTDTGTWDFRCHNCSLQLGYNLENRETFPRPYNAGQGHLLNLIKKGVKRAGPTEA